MQLYLGNPAYNHALDSSYKLCVLSVVQNYHVYFSTSHIKHYCRPRTVALTLTHREGTVTGQDLCAINYVTRRVKDCASQCH